MLYYLIKLSCKNTNKLRIAQRSMWYFQTMWNGIILGRTSFYSDLALQNLILIFYLAHVTSIKTQGICIGLSTRMLYAFLHLTFDRWKMQFSDRRMLACKMFCLQIAYYYAANLFTASNRTYCSFIHTL